MDLTSSRILGPAGPGPISYNAIHEYCQAEEIYGEQRDAVFYHVTRLDRLYLERQFKKKPKDAPPPAAKGARPARRR